MRHLNLINGQACLLLACTGALAILTGCGTEVQPTSRPSQPPHSAANSGDEETGGDHDDGESDQDELCEQFVADACDVTGRYLQGVCSNGNSNHVDCRELGSAGRCEVHLTQGAQCTTAPLVPELWECETDYYNTDDGCDCGCGARDPDCANAARSSCDYNACPEGSSPTLNNSAVCTPIDEAWTCSPALYFDLEVCDCGCGVPDPDCTTNTTTSCNQVHCGTAMRLGADTLTCEPIPSLSIDNPSFELTPAGNEVPGWTKMHVQGNASAYIIGQADTDAPDGGRALRLTSTYQFDGVYGFRGVHVVLSSTFLPPAGVCTATFAVGDFFSGGSGTGGGFRVRGEGLPSNLSTLARVALSPAASAQTIVPPSQGYADFTLSWQSDGTTSVHLEIEADAPYNSRRFNVDNVRLGCE